ncbi:polysaccharide pyruvyl transferase family protein [Sphingomonas sp. RP10(2022)]|uniref:Polysaccharide pyruvyl transferase family protein n=1 Tax=Sphingomonas liriopis TaxID=2949094 RepID=A0A9X2KQW7_9SPHN|nr:polysaccharide pyruvyl transferase family protein [Sphingomonas liriopis]MCP3736149.1 polysaccharide pyruvyl transferase family protein [Sphingomonas liriopis]
MTNLAALAAPYRAHVAPGQAYALVDFPDHANVGDSAIWLGELAILRALTGCGPVYVSTWHDFDLDAFRRACPTGPLFLHGGGNLGDIWPHHQRFREAVLAEVRDRPVVQLPQSIHFRDPARAARFAALVADHPDFTLYVRDARSLALANRFACPTHLVPDSAMALGPQPRGEPEVPLLMLLRSDDERRDHGGPPPAQARVVDWLEDDAGMPAGTTPAAREAQARARVARGLRLLGQGEVVVTDRLHGSILAGLLAIPHVVLDNDYGKIAAYLAAWPSPALTATTMAQAVELAGRLLPAR